MELSRQSHQTIPYRNLPQADYCQVLQQAGIPEVLAVMLAESDAEASAGGLFDDSMTLSRSIGRPTTPLRDAITTALGA